MTRAVRIAWVVALTCTGAASACPVPAAPPAARLLPAPVVLTSSSPTPCGRIEVDATGARTTAWRRLSPSVPRLAAVFARNPDLGVLRRGGRLGIRSSVGASWWSSRPHPLPTGVAMGLDVAALSTPDGRLWVAARGRAEVPVGRGEIPLGVTTRGVLVTVRYRYGLTDVFVRDRPYRVAVPVVVGRVVGGVEPLPALRRHAGRGPLAHHAQRWRAASHGPGAGGHPGGRARGERRAGGPRHADGARRAAVCGGGPGGTRARARPHAQGGRPGGVRGRAHAVAGRAAGGGARGVAAGGPPLGAGGGAGGATGRRAPPAGRPHRPARPHPGGGPHMDPDGPLARVVGAAHRRRRHGRGRRHPHRPMRRPQRRGTGRHAAGRPARHGTA